jgi:peroxiredoxin
MYFCKKIKLMRKILLGITLLATLFACNQNEDKGMFTVHGDVKNTDNQKIYLEQLFFSEKNPEVVDTAEIKDGKFTIGVKAIEEGLYRLRFEKQETGFVFINDKSNINFTADLKDASLQGLNFSTPANKTFKEFIAAVNLKNNSLSELSKLADSLQKNSKNDSLKKASIASLSAAETSYKKFILKCIDTISNPVVASFAMGLTRGINPEEVKAILPNLTKRFPAQQSVQDVIASYTKMIAQPTIPPAATAPAPKATGAIAIGNMAPEFTMADTEGKPVSLSSYKGKYVLVDFWASWCGPCRGENPNVVDNYDKFKGKNFTILGVSLDEDKAAWLAAIKKDNLTWTHVSDLKGWSNAAAKLYGVETIPFNVLLDPTGKIIAMDLRDEDLGRKLGEMVR